MTGALLKKSFILPGQGVGRSIVISFFGEGADFIATDIKSASFN